ncbi:MAG: ParB/RepB/Spo0J family partition protein [Clostridia bacterium]|nr:ParB/RepB/Spo0J family partition protein [Clostridia bacterium]
MRMSRDKKLMMLKPSQIKQVDIHKASYSPLQLKSLIDSIAANGIIEPLLVKRESRGNYLLLSGGKRLYCAKTVGLRRVPCIVCRADNLSAQIYRITSNLCRYNSPFFEQAELIKELVDTQGLTTCQAAARLGLSACAVENKLKILTLSQSVLDKIKANGLSEATARILCRMTEENQKVLLSRLSEATTDTRLMEEEISRLLSAEEDRENIQFEKEEPQESGIKIKAAIGDKKLFRNSLARLVTKANEAGVNAYFKTVETEKYTEYKIRIDKQSTPCFEQLKIV